MSKISVLRLPAITLSLALAPLLVGCGENFEDADFGGVDLLEFFWDTGVNGEPPGNYWPTDGYLNGELAFYYDFGKVAVRNDFPSEEVRAELLGILARARAAPQEPWPAKEASYWGTVFPQMANWLPDEEAARLRQAFATELNRLQVALR